MQNKIAEITIYFWILKIIATTLGEAFGDALSMTLEIGYILSFILTGIVLSILLFFQIRSRQFHSYLFWGAIIATTTVGTEVSDMLDRSFHLGYFTGSLLLIACLSFTLAFWYRKERTLSIYPINNRYTETMFWIAVIFSNSLGTAFGDYLTDNIGLSYLVGALVTSGVIVLVLLLHYLTKVNEVFLFWVAFIFTRPFGATFGDFLTKPHSNGGLELGRIESSIVLFIVFCIVLHISHKRHHAD